MVGQKYEFGKLPTDEPEVIATTYYESDNEGSFIFFLGVIRDKKDRL